MSNKIPVVLTIAGSDSSGGAGIQADLKAFAACGVYGATAITALTAQNTTGVLGVLEIAPEFVVAQVDAVARDLVVAATKTGMLPSAAIIEAVAGRVRENHLSPLVVDPVMRASTGASLMQADAGRALTRYLFPLASLVTPNLPEAEILTGRRVASMAAMREAARAIHGLGAAAVLVKGGHLAGAADAVDVLFDGRDFHEFRAPRIDTANTHGSGCTLAAAITAYLAQGMSLLGAVRRGKDLVGDALRSGLAIGKGNGPVNALGFLLEGAETKQIELTLTNTASRPVETDLA